MAGPIKPETDLLTGAPTKPKSEGIAAAAPEALPPVEAVDVAAEEEEARVHIPPAPPAEEKVPVKSRLTSGSQIAAIVPDDVESTYRLAEMFVLGGMVPRSYEVLDDEYDDKGVVVLNKRTNKPNKIFNYKATCSRTAIAIMHGMAVGFAPTVALGSIMIINNKPCIYGDGASALVNASGAVEYIKCHITEGEGDNAGWRKGYKVTITAKRKGVDEPVVRSFSFEDAAKAQLSNKKGPWMLYPKRQCYWRAYSWAVRDQFSDVLCGLAIAEEMLDLHTVEARRGPTDTSSLDKGPALLPSPVPAGATTTTPTPAAPTPEPEKPKEPAEPTAPKSDWDIMADEIIAQLAKHKTEKALETYLDIQEPKLTDLQKNAPAEVFNRVAEAVELRRVQLSPAAAG